jgi:hypothetical protein
MGDVASLLGSVAWQQSAGSLGYGTVGPPHGEERPTSGCEDRATAIVALCAKSRIIR